MSTEEHRLVHIWEDTVDLRELLVGLVWGSALGFGCYSVSLAAFTSLVPSQAPDLLKGYALMGGIVGCVIAAVVVALAVKPKRRLLAPDAKPVDHAELLDTLALDPDEERRALQNASPKLIQEMRQLQIYDLFADFTGVSGSPRRSD